jgi:uncharacterized protein (TIGR02147 family)
MADMVEKEPDLLQYTNYRVYLKDYYEFKKKNSAAFSLRYFAEKAGLSSHAHLKLVIDGKRSITKSTVTKLIIGLGLDSRRAEYFENLVFFNQASDDKEKQLFYEKLLKSSPHSRFRKLEEAQFRIFREWYHSVVREMATLKTFRGQPEWIAQHLAGGVTPSQAGESLKLLVELGLLTRTANGYKQQNALLTTEDEVQDLLVKQYHAQMIHLAAEALQDVPAAERDVSALTFGIRKKDFPALKKHLQLMRKELLDFSVDAGEADEVVQVNIQLFPLTRGI